MKNICLVLAFCQSLLMSSIAFALDLDAAKKQGLVGEQLNGYLGAVIQKPSPEVATLIKDINKKRQLKYQEIAKKNGTSLKNVEALAGKKASEKTKSGHYYQNSAGKWVKK